MLTKWIVTLFMFLSMFSLLMWTYNLKAMIFCGSVEVFLIGLVQLIVENIYQAGRRRG